MSYLSCVLIVLSSMVMTATCQTFQYSRGWTNGKRDNSKLVGLPLEFEAKNLATDPTQAIDPIINYCAFHKLKMLLQKDDGDEQLNEIYSPIYFLPCERLAASVKGLKLNKASNHHRHLSTNEENNDNDNYGAP